MADLLQPDKNSRQNIALFLNSVEDPQIRQLLTAHLEDILAVGRDTDDQNSRQRCFESVQALIDQRIEACR